MKHHSFRIKEKHPETSPTFGLGVAVVNGSENRRPAKLLKKADGALYEPKRSGRNRVSS